MTCNPRELAVVVGEALRTVKVSGFDVDIVSCGLVRLVRVSNDCKRVVVYMGFLDSHPRCPFCGFINITLWSKIAEDVTETLGRLGFERVEVVDIRSATTST